MQIRTGPDRAGSIQVLTISVPVTHGLLPGLIVRLYLLNRSGGHTLAVEVDDLNSGSHLAVYERFVQSLEFAS